MWYHGKKRGFGEQKYLGSNSTSVSLGKLSLLNDKNDNLKVISKATLKKENHKGKSEQIWVCKNLKRKKFYRYSQNKSKEQMENWEQTLAASTDIWNVIVFNTWETFEYK